MRNGFIVYWPDVAGVHKIMVTGTTVQSSKEALRLTRLYPETLYSTAGMSHLVRINTQYQCNSSML